MKGAGALGVEQSKMGPKHDTTGVPAGQARSQMGGGGRSSGKAAFASGQATRNNGEK